MMNSLFSCGTYIGSFEELPESGNLNDTAFSKGSLYCWRDGWQEIINYEENLLDKMIKAVREASDCELKRELEKLIEEENKRNGALV